MLLDELNTEKVELKEEIENSDRMLQNAAIMYKKQNKMLTEAKIELRKRQSQDVISRWELNFLHLSLPKWRKNKNTIFSLELVASISTLEQQESDQ